MMHIKICVIMVDKVNKRLYYLDLVHYSITNSEVMFLTLISLLLYFFLRFSMILENSFLIYSVFSLDLSSC